LILENLKDGAWKGHRAFIIGGGPSLKGFDWKLLRREKTIGVNKAILKIFPDIMIGMDYRFWNKLLSGDLGDVILRRVKRMKGLKIYFRTGKSLANKFSWANLIEIVPNQNNKNAFTTSFSKGLGHGKNSGFTALNVAVNLRANPIYLLGFDMKGHPSTKKQVWWHEGYPFSVNDESIYRQYIRNFEVHALPVINKLDLKVINLNPASELKCFEFAKPEDIFENNEILEDESLL